jgi:hypothetical protein
MVGSVKLPVSVLDPKVGYRPFAHAVGNFSECRSAALTLLQKGKGTHLFLYLVEFYIFVFLVLFFFFSLAFFRKSALCFPLLNSAGNNESKLYFVETTAFTIDKKMLHYL